MLKSSGEQAELAVQHEKPRREPVWTCTCQLVARPEGLVWKGAAGQRAGKGGLRTQLEYLIQGLRLYFVGNGKPLVISE